MKPLPQTFLALAVVAALSFVAQRREPGIDLRNPEIVGYWREDVERLRPDVVLVGNSIAGHAFDEHLFTQLTGVHAYGLTHTGTATAWWYLALKNIVAPASHHPRVLAIVFRDNTLTAPTLYARVNSAFIEKVARREEPLLDELAYRSALSPLGRFLHRYSPLFRLREPAKAAFENAAKHTAARLVEVRFDAVDEAIERTFAMHRMNPDLLGERQEDFERSEAATDEPFRKVIDASFLPHIVRLARENAIQLVFVRARKRRDLLPDAEPEHIRRYVADLRRWLDARNIPLIDLTPEERLTADLYASGDHLNRREGRDTFTRILAERLQPILADETRRPAPVPAVDVLPRNASFETWGAFYRNRPEHWRSYYMDDIACATDQVRDGRFALELASPGGQRTEAFQDIPLPAGAAGRRLVLEGEARADSPDAARLSIMLFDGTWHVADGPAHPGDGSWHRVRVDQPVPANPGLARVYLKLVFQSDAPHAQAHFDKLRVRVE